MNCDDGDAAYCSAVIRGLKVARDARPDVEESVLLLLCSSYSSSSERGRHSEPGGHVFAGKTHGNEYSTNDDKIPVWSGNDEKKSPNGRKKKKNNVNENGVNPETREAHVTADGGRTSEAVAVAAAAAASATVAVAETGDRLPAIVASVLNVRRRRGSAGAVG